MRILLVSYFFPPSTDTGAHRPASMARHLARLGHEVTVLTTRAYGKGEPGGDRAAGPAAAGEAVASAHAVERAFDLQLVRARLGGRRTIASMYDADTYSTKPHPLAKVVVPEPLALAWAPFAIRRALALNGRRRFDCVITTSPPESAHMVGRALGRRGVPWVADLRDAWTFEPIRPDFPTALQHRIDRRLEASWLRGADVVTCVSRPAADDLRRRLGLDPLLVPNGFDADAPEARAASSSGVELDEQRTSLVYTGRFGSYGRDPRALVAALSRLSRESPEAAARLELVVAGPLTDPERKLLESVPGPVRVLLSGSLPRARAVALQREADALLLLADSRRSQLANFKLFEYLGAGRPLLALAAGTEAGRIAAEAGCEVVSASEEAEVARALARLAEGGVGAPQAQAVERYTYPHVALLMAGACKLARSNAAHRAAPSAA